MTTLREHVYLGVTQSLCPDCLAVVSAKIVSRDGRVYFQKRCPLHGPREDFVCSDVRWFDRMEYTTPGKIPRVFGTEPKRGCPLDCGLCSEHEQHTCIALLEITSSCNLTCPMCFAESAPGGQHLTEEQCRYAIDRLVRVEGKPEVLQLSGGEPTIHPNFLSIAQYACDQPIDIVMINSNGIRFARDAEFTREVAKLNRRAEVYLQFDSFRDDDYESLRGKSLLDTKLKAIERLGEHGIHTTLVCTVQSGVNEDQLGDIIRLGLSHPHVTGVSFQPATYSGRYFLPEQLEQRVTFPDVIKLISQQSGETFSPQDFLPLPCAHPNAHTLTYAYRSEHRSVPLNRFLDIEGNMDLLANGIVFTRERLRGLIETYSSRGGCGSDCYSSLKSVEVRQANTEKHEEGIDALAREFFSKAFSGSLKQSDLMRVTITSFMDAYNFDVRQVMKSCVHHLLPSGHLIPFSAYNVLYRNGHVGLPELTDASGTDPISVENARAVNARAGRALPVVTTT